MGNMHTLLDQRRLTDLAADPDFKPAAAPKLTRADHMIASGHARRAAYRALNPNADTAMTYGAQIGYLHAQIRVLDDELQAFNVVRDSTLDYLTVDSPDFSTQLVVGFAYTPGCAASPTSAYTYVMTGDPGDPGESEELELTEVWVNGCELAGNLSDPVIESISAVLLTKLHLLESKAREQDEPF